MQIVKINNTYLTCLSGYTVEWYDLSSSSVRNANGDMTLSIVNNKRKLILKTPYLTQSEVTTLFALIPAGSISVTFYDPFTATTLTKNMYRGDRNASLYWDKTTKLFEPMDISLIEL